MNQDNKYGEAGIILREQVWLEICQCVFDTILEAYSRIKKCSIEGKSNMILDLKILQSNLDAIHNCKPPRGKIYVEEYIHGSSLQNEALLNWVQENWQSYAYRHIYNLLHMVLKSSVLTSSKKLTEALAILDGYYETIDMDRK